MRLACSLYNTLDVQKYNEIFLTSNPKLYDNILCTFVSNLLALFEYHLLWFNFLALSYTCFEINYIKVIIDTNNIVIVDQVKSSCINCKATLTKDDGERFTEWPSFIFINLHFLMLCKTCEKFKYMAEDFFQ